MVALSFLLECGLEISPIEFKAENKQANKQKPTWQKYTHIKGTFSKKENMLIAQW